MDWIDAVDRVKFRREFSSSKPFPHLVLKNFFSQRINDVAGALMKEHFHFHNSDLFQFAQTDDIKNTKNSILKDFYKFFSSKEFIKLVSDITGKKLRSIDMSGFIYSDTDYLLPHDDRLEGRKIAYVLNLSKNFTALDGGNLFLFKNNKVVKKIPPSFNTLTLFEVSSKSLHQVQEVLSNKKRVSLAGWFHA